VLVVIHKDCRLHKIICKPMDDGHRGPVSEAG